MKVQYFHHHVLKYIFKKKKPIYLKQQNENSYLAELSRTRNTLEELAIQSNEYLTTLRLSYGTSNL